jgi:hypothetical protein
VQEKGCRAVTFESQTFAQFVCHDYMLLLMEGVLSKFVTEFPYENLYAKCNFNINWEITA